MREKVRDIVKTALEECYSTGSLVSGQVPPVVIETPANPEHGDFATNVAMQLAKPERKAPRAVAEILVRTLAEKSDLFAGIDIAGPGFINFTLQKRAWQQLLPAIDSCAADYGRSNFGQGRNVQIEFVSANPTGPLHIGHGRGAAIGDTICRLLAATGWNVTREFYYNDAGQQISNLALSVQSRCLGIEPDDPRWPSDGYQGEYIKDVARAYLARESVHAGDQHVTADGDANNIEEIRRFAVAYLRREQDQDLQAFDVGFDNYFLESSLYSDGLVESTVQRLISSGHTYEQDGALWLKTTDFGDDKDRVMRKTDGGYTYFVPDVAYHLNKWERGFVRVINEQGADHHSTITRVRAGLQALDAGIPTGWPEYVLHQMVTVMRGGEEVKISKRAGSYVTLRDLIDEVGRDATRYFFIMRKPDSQLVFDIDLAKQHSSDNPVYYVQYAHARICRIFESARENGEIPAPSSAHIGLLDTVEEINIIKSLASFPEIVQGAADNFEPHRIASYLHGLASELHAFYNRHRVLGDDPALTSARLYLLDRVRQTIANALGMLGVTAPERM
ncbi:MAG TPA: arginine--tRNA ligase [Geobacteraceae bacterium]|nr:arginine--tRNA ligase [Geobacteraceae bacterium]